MKTAEDLNTYFNKHIRSTIGELNSRGITMVDVAEVNRRKADTFDRELTKAANCNDRENFLKTLKRWKECFLQIQTR